ncbi:MAG TPA: hypothetical protein PLR99_27795, partial [Polyangiaceae bacterium]|nr:hypothetical protein [Polyangiaceae bacterium]
MRFIDIGATGALEYAYGAPTAFMQKFNRGYWARDITIPLPAPDDWGAREAHRLWAQGDADWILIANRWGEAELVTKRGAPRRSFVRARPAEARSEERAEPSFLGEHAP